MAITVRQLLDQQRVRLSLRAGAAGLDREVRWAHASDLADPWQYLARNEALLTNGQGMTGSPEAQARFVARLERAGASALGYGLETGPPLSIEALHEADQVGLPLFTLDRQARFSALAQLVAEANASHERRELQQVAHLYEILHEALANHAGTEELLKELGDEIGALMQLVDPTQAPPISSRSTVMLPLDDRPPVALLVEAVDQDLPSRTLLQHVATAVTIELAQLRAAAHEPQRSSVLSDLLTGRVPLHEGRESLAVHGLDPAHAILVAARRTAPPGAAPAAYLPVGGWSGLRHVAASGGGRCHVLVDCGSEPRLDGLAVSGWVVGVSSVLGAVERLPAATAESQWYAATAELLGREVVTAADPSTWPLPSDRDAAGEATRETVAMLREHDAERGTAYVDTMRVWLEVDRSWQRAATVLAIHKQTLGYRLRRIEELTGRGLTSTADLTAWWLGVRADRLLQLADQWDTPAAQ